MKKLKSKHNSASLTVTGHSLGGALATHAVVFLIKVLFIIKL